MKKASYFPHPQPLSPNTRAEPKQIGERLVWIDKKKGRLKGVGTTQSIYYLWFEYLKRSEKYKKACANNGKGMKAIYKDFGNIFQYKTDAMGYTDVNDFYYKWWEKRGAELFGIQDTENELREFASYEDVVSLKSDIEDWNEQQIEDCFCYIKLIPTKASISYVYRLKNKGETYDRT